VTLGNLDRRLQIGVEIMFWGQKNIGFRNHEF